MVYSRQGINNGNVKINNRALVLRLLFSNGAMSRSEIAEALNLTRATVTTICSDFFSQGLLVQMGEMVELSRAGRKKCPVALRYNRLSVLAINIYPGEISICLCDLKGSVYDSLVYENRRATSAEFILKEVARNCRMLLQNNDTARKDILGIGVVTIGPVDHEKGIS
jgi:DNA-binding MarR family transcriptional regulator